MKKWPNQQLAESTESKQNFLSASKNDYSVYEFKLNEKGLDWHEESEEERPLFYSSTSGFDTTGKIYSVLFRPTPSYCHPDPRNILYLLYYQDRSLVSKQFNLEAKQGRLEYDPNLMRWFYFQETKDKKQVVIYSGCVQSLIGSPIESIDMMADEYKCTSLTFGSLVMSTHWLLNPINEKGFLLVKTCEEQQHDEKLQLYFFQYGEKEIAHYKKIEIEQSEYSKVFVKHYYLKRVYTVEEDINKIYVLSQEGLRMIDKYHLTCFDDSGKLLFTFELGVLRENYDFFDQLVM
eukprot:TCONS_00064279-protein